MVLLNHESRLLTGSADSELRAWDIQYIEEVRHITHAVPNGYFVGWITFQYSLECDTWTLRELKLISYIQNDIKVSSQGKEVGEPKEKKVRTLLENEEEDEEGLDEEPEEVIFFQYFLQCTLFI